MDDEWDEADEGRPGRKEPDKRSDIDIISRPIYPVTRHVITTAIAPRMLALSEVKMSSGPQKGGLKEY